MNNTIEELIKYSENSPTVVKIVGVFSPFDKNDKETWLIQNGQLLKVEYISKKIPIPIKENISGDEFMDSLIALFKRPLAKITMSTHAKKRYSFDEEKFGEIIATSLDSFLSQLNIFLNSESNRELGTI